MVIEALPSGLLRIKDQYVTVTIAETSENKDELGARILSFFSR